MKPNDRGPAARFVTPREPRAGEWKAALVARDVIVDARDDVLQIGLGLHQYPDDLMKFIQIAATL